MKEIDINNIKTGETQESIFCSGCGYCERAKQNKIIGIGSCPNDKFLRKDATQESLVLITEKLNELIRKINESNIVEKNSYPQESI